MSVLEFHSCLSQAKLSISHFNMGNFLLPIIIPVSQIALSGNYQGAVFILNSGKKEFFITMFTAASQELLFSQLWDLGTSFECTIQWHISEWWGSSASTSTRKNGDWFSPLSLNALSLFMFFHSHYCIWIPLGIT